MIRARCISERKSMSNQIKVGNEYWIDESTAWKDHDGDEYAQVYLDKDKEHRVGDLLTCHFETLELDIEFSGIKYENDKINKKADILLKKYQLLINSLKSNSSN